MSRFTRVDDHGVEEYQTWVLFSLTILCFFLINYGGGAVLWYFESQSQESALQNYWDAEWTVFNTMTTIGYGDFSASTWQGRIATKLIAFAGFINIGAIVTYGAKMLKTDRSVQNRELRTMVCELLRSKEAIEETLGITNEINKFSNSLDVIFEQLPYCSDNLRDGFLTIGRDSSGMYMMSVEAYDRETDQPYRRWLPASSRTELNHMYHRYLRNDHEL